MLSFSTLLYSQAYFTTSDFDLKGNVKTVKMNSFPGKIENGDTIQDGQYVEYKLFVFEPIDPYFFQLDFPNNVSRPTFYFDNQNRLVKLEDYSSINNELRTKTDFLFDDRLVQIKFSSDFGKNTVKYIPFCENNLVTKFKIYFGEESETFKEFQYEYDAFNRIIKCSKFLNKLYIGEFRYIYNANNNITSKKQCFGENISMSDNYFYNSKKQMEKIIRNNEDGNVMYIIEISYFENGSIKSIVTTYPDGEIIEKFSYKYDSYGNWIKRIRTTDYGSLNYQSICIYTREIVYY